MKFEYVIPGETTVSRKFLAETLDADQFDVSVAGEIVAVVDYETMRGYMLGKVTLQDLVSQGESA